MELADWILTQQITDSNKQAYGGFVSVENSTSCYSVDIGRIVPALLKAYELTSNLTYLNSAKLAVGTFLFNTQQNPNVLDIHDRFYGGFARAVDTAGVWQPQIDVESLYSLIALRMLSESDPANKDKYQTMIQDAVNFYRPGIESLNLFFDPLPGSDGAWHRVGLEDDTIYDDSIAYALLGLYDYEGYSVTVQKTYQAIGAIAASPQYPAYNSGVCWAGYINVKAKTLACDYYDAVTSGILAKIRRHHDKPAYDFSAKTIQKHADEFMFLGTQTRKLRANRKQASHGNCVLVGRTALRLRTAAHPIHTGPKQQRRKPNPKPNNPNRRCPSLRRRHRPQSHSFAQQS